MSAHTTGIMKPGVSKLFGSYVFTAVPEGNEGKIVAVFGFCGASDEAESIANLECFCSCWNALDGIPLNEIKSAERSGSFSLALHKVILQREKLITALKTLRNACADAGWATDPTHVDHMEESRVAIAEETKGTA